MASLEPSTASSNFPAEQYTHLANAGSEVNNALKMDEPGGNDHGYLKLSEKLTITNNNSSTNNYFYMPYGLPRGEISPQSNQLPGWQLPQFVRYGDQSMIPLAILNHVQTASALTLKGLLPEIGRTWISVDSTLYLWNYDASDVDGSAAYNRYSELDQVITAVAVVLPRKDTFQDFISHVLVIATTVEIILVGVEKQGSRVKDPIHLHPTALRVSTDGVRINKIVGTFEGRIFMGGSDSYVYEFQYSQDTWRRYFGYTCVKRNMSASIASWLIPQTVLEYYQVDPIIDIVVDNSRQLLYTLSQKQVITVYDLGDDGESFSKRHKLPPLAVAGKNILIELTK
jgi:nuclear pore complex protein Nup155